MLELDQNGQKELKSAQVRGNLSRFFTAAATAGTVALAAARTILLLESGNATTTSIALTVWGSAFLGSMLSLFFVMSFESQKADQVDKVANIQKDRYRDKAMKLVSEAQYDFVIKLHIKDKKDHNLNDQDIRIMTTLPDNKLETVPNWVPLGETFKRMNTITTTSQSQQGSHFYQKANTLMKRPYDDDYARISMLPVLNILTGTLPFYLLYKAFKWQTPTAEDFTLPNPEKPDLAQYVQDLGIKTKAPSPA